MENQTMDPEPFEKTRERVLEALEMAVDLALEKLTSPKPPGPREHKEILALLVKAAEQMHEYAPAQLKPFHTTKTDQLLLDLYVERRNARTL